MEWCSSVPKIELHAHLNGSIRDSTLLELAKNLGEKGLVDFSEIEHAIRKNDRSLSEVFKLFDVIHILTTDHSTVTRITREVVEDFASDNVLYVELRTTPKRNGSRGMTKRSYMEAVLEGLKAVDVVDVDLGAHEMEARNSSLINNANGLITRTKIYVRLLLSIDRRETTEAAMETVKLALEMRDSGVVGIDLSGNPSVGEWNTFLPALRFAKEQGLYVTLHCGEVPNMEEVNAMLDFRPQRIGHACYFGNDEWEKLKALKIPVEICLTSNITTQSVPSIEFHHFAALFNDKHPLILCTDDSGIFSTTLSREYYLAAITFGIGNIEMFRLARSAIDFIFADDAVKEKLRMAFKSSAEMPDSSSSSSSSSS